MKCKSWDKTKLEKNWRSTGQSTQKQMHGNPDSGVEGRHLPDLHARRYDILEDHGAQLGANADKRMEDQEMEMPSLVEEKNANLEFLNRDDEGGCGDNPSGVHWDIFRRQDVPKLINYLQKHSKELGRPGSLDDIVSFALSAPFSLISEGKIQIKNESPTQVPNSVLILFSYIILFLKFFYLQLFVTSTCSAYNRLGLVSGDLSSF